jgi:hypothetical protein
MALKKKKKKAVAAAPVADEFETMSLEQLQDEVNKYTGRISEVRRSRNYYMLERDQVNQFKEVVEEDVEKTMAHVRNIESQMERMQDTHRNDVKIYLQKVIHLEYEHAHNVDAVTKEGGEDLAKETEAHSTEQLELKEEKLRLKQ